SPRAPVRSEKEIAPSKACPSRCAQVILMGDKRSPFFNLSTRTAFSSHRDAGTSMEDDRPIASFAEKPNMASAAAFQVTMTPSCDSLIMASAEDSTMAASRAPPRFSSGEITLAPFFAAVVSWRDPDFEQNIMRFRKATDLFKERNMRAGEVGKKWGFCAA